MPSGSSKHYSDASYEIWSRGGNPDRLDYDRSDNDYYNDRSPEYTANSFFREQRDARERREQLDSMDDYYADQQAEYWDQYEQYLIPDEYYQALPKED